AATSATTPHASPHPLQPPSQPSQPPPQPQPHASQQQRQKAVGGQLGKSYHVFNGHIFRILQGISPADESFREAFCGFFNTHHPVHHETIFPGVENHVAHFYFHRVHRTQQDGVTLVQEHGAHAVASYRQTHGPAGSYLFADQQQDIFIG
ncbi:MAG: hypothetical protein WC875_05945, partial [Candidatus Absconditabacterales bacterium]